MQGTDSKKIIVHGSSDSPLVDVAAKLLSGAGFEVSNVESSEQLLSLASNVSTELMILGGSTDDVGETLDRLALLPSSQKPNNVAILSGDAEGEQTFLTRKLPGCKVHIFASPVQAFGLLSLVKRISRKTLQHN